jgi:hypothetical protein
MKYHLDNFVNLMNDSKKNRYLLVDKLRPLPDYNLISVDNIVEFFFDKQADKNAKKERVVPILRPDLIHDIEHCPHLILIADQNESINPELLALSLKEASSELFMDKRYICAWLISDLPLTQLAEELVTIGETLAKEALTINSRFFPYYEPFRMQLLHESNLIYQQWLPRQLKGIAQYCYLNLSRKIKIIQKPEPNEILGFSQISDRTVSYQQYAKQIFLCFKTLIESKQIKTPDDRQLIMVADKWLDSIRTGLADLEDQFAFVINSLFYNIDLMNQAQTQQAVFNAIENPGTLKQNLSVLRQSQWGQVK